MAYFPFYIDISDKCCLVVGGGQVAFRKIQKLMPFGSRIKVVAPEINDEIAKLDGIEIVRRNFEDDDLNGVFMVISATDDEAVNLLVFNLCKERNILVNTVDDKDKCSFIFPAIISKNDITIGISTNGKSPLCARFLRENIENVIDERHFEAASVLGSYRKLIKKEFSTEAQRKNVLEALLNMCLADDKIPSEVQIDAMIKEMKNSYENQNRNP